MSFENLTNLKSLTMMAALVILAAASSHAADGIMLDIVVHESIDADPPETAVVDSVTYPILFDQPTTLRAGNFVVDVTAVQGANGSVDLQVSGFVSGPLPSTFSDGGNIVSGAVMVIDGIRGKGKSQYSARFTPHAASLTDTGRTVTGDSAHWQTIYSLRARYHLPKGVLPPLQFSPVRGVVDQEFEELIDTLGLDRSDRLMVFLAPHPFAGWPVDPDYGYAVDPARYRMVATHEPLAPRIDTRALVFAALCRSWGYAPRLLMMGIAGYYEFSDYDVRADIESASSIPIDSLARTIDYKRFDCRVADHHASSFVTWLIHTNGLPHFKSLYERATDLSIHRAVWSVYGKTLSELETQWREFLKQREFHREELYYFASREKAFRKYESHLALLEKAAAVDGPATFEILRDIGIAQGQMGRWGDAVTSFTRLVDEYPDDIAGYWFLAEAYRAAGDDISASRTYAQLSQRTPTDANLYLRVGEILWDGRRADSASVLWRHGLSNSPGSLTRGELLLHMGHDFERRRGGMDSARAYFGDARRSVSQILIENPTEVSAWIISAEAFLCLDSVSVALDYLTVAEIVSDAPVDLARVLLLQGMCYDKFEQRKVAVAKYRAALSENAPEPVARLARRYLNRRYAY